MDKDTKKLVIRLCEHIKRLREQSSESVYMGDGLCEWWSIQDLNELFKTAGKIQEKINKND